MVLIRNQIMFVLRCVRSSGTSVNSEARLRMFGSVILHTDQEGRKKKQNLE